MKHLWICTKTAMCQYFDKELGNLEQSHVQKKYGIINLSPIIKTLNPDCVSKRGKTVDN